MSLITPSNSRAEVESWLKRLRWRVSSVVLSSSVDMPSTAFMGVRISWLMLARNWLLARFACSAGRVPARARARTAAAAGTSACSVWRPRSRCPSSFCSTLIASTASTSITDRHQGAVGHHLAPDHRGERLVEPRAHLERGHSDQLAAVGVIERDFHREGEREVLGRRRSSEPGSAPSAS
jgi:hypothetical protein